MGRALVCAGLQSRPDYCQPGKSTRCSSASGSGSAQAGDGAALTLTIVKWYGGRQRTRNHALRTLSFGSADGGVASATCHKSGESGHWCVVSPNSRPIHPFARAPRASGRCPAGPLTVRFLPTARGAIRRRNHADSGPRGQSGARSRFRLCSDESPRDCERLNRYCRGEFDQGVGRPDAADDRWIVRELPCSVWSTSNRGAFSAVICQSR